MRKIFIIYLLACTAVFAQNTTPQQEPSVEVYAGLGWDQLFNASFADFLSANGMTAIDPLRTWRTGWRFVIGVNRFSTAVGGSRTTNFVFGPYGEAQRARFAWDSTDLTAGVKIVTTDTVSWTLGAGVGVSKVLLQAYGSAGGSFSTVYGSPGSIGLVTSWNWTPEAETFFGVRVVDLGESGSIWAQAGVQAGWLPFDATWKLFEDPTVTGVPKPFDFFVRYALWIGVR